MAHLCLCGDNTLLSHILCGFLCGCVYVFVCVCVPLLLNGAPQKFFSLKFVEDLKGEFTNFHRGSWRFVSMRGTQITWFRACGNYQTSSDDEKKAQAT